MNAFLARGLAWVGAKRRRRLNAGAALTGAFLFHVILLLLALSWRAPPMAMAGASEQISLFSFAGLVKSAPAPSDKPVEQKAKPAVPRAADTTVLQLAAERGVAIRSKPVFQPPTDLEPVLIDVVLGGGAPPAAEALPVLSPAIQALAAAQAGGKSCRIFDVLQSMLQTSEEVRQGLPKIPTQARSVANALLLWDRRWADAPSLGGMAGLGPIQSVVFLAVSSAPPSCQAELVRGPRLITVGDAHDTTVLAFGSGEWRWGDLLVSPLVPQSSNQLRP